MVGCSVVIGGASFAGEKSTADKIKTTLEDNDMKIEEMDNWTDAEWDEAFEALGYDGDDWDDEDYDEEGFDGDDWDEEDYDFDYPENGADFVKELVEEFSLTEAEKVSLEKLYDEAIALESGEEIDWDKVDSKWEEIDNVLVKYEMAEIMAEELPTVDEFVEDMCIDKDKLESKQLDALKDFRTDLEKYQKSQNTEKFTETYDNLFTWIDENIEESQWSEMEDFGDEFDGEFDDEFENMTEEEYNQMIFDEIKEYSVDELVKEFPTEITKDDTALVKSLHADMVKAADNKDMEKVEALYEKLEEVFVKYYGDMDEDFEEMDMEEDQE